MSSRRLASFILIRFLRARWLCLRACRTFSLLPLGTAFAEAERGGESATAAAATTNGGGQGRSHPEAEGLRRDLREVRLE